VSGCVHGGGVRVSVCVHGGGRVCVCRGAYMAEGKRASVGVCAWRRAGVRVLGCVHGGGQACECRGVCMAEGRYASVGVCAWRKAGGVCPGVYMAEGRCASVALKKYKYAKVRSCTLYGRHVLIKILIVAICNLKLAIARTRFLTEKWIVAT
jgi:hypothetical protein